MFPNIPPSAITTTPDVVAPMEMLAKRPGRRGLHVVEHNPAWADDFSDLRSWIRAALGAAALEAAGFTLYFRQPAYYGHRFLGCQTPDTNIHVYGPECPDVARHLIFREWLSGHPGDRDRYAAVKREVAVVAEEKGESGNQYGKRKEWVIREILDRAFRANGLLPDASNGDARVQ